MKELIFDDTDYLAQLRQRTVFLNHIHWDGSVPWKSIPATNDSPEIEGIFDFYKRTGKPLLKPEEDIRGNPIQDRSITCAEDMLELPRLMFKRYKIGDVFDYAINAMKTPEDIRQMAVAHCHYLKYQSVAYSETRFAPWYHTDHLSMDQVIGYALEGFTLGEDETGVIVKPIICVNREIDGEQAKDVVRAALRFEGRVVGIDLACYEPGRPPELFEEAFALTFDTSLKRTVHAGEMCDNEQNVKNIYTALTKLRANGIGHAIPLHNHDGLVDLFLENNVRLESNPLSNLQYFIEDAADLHLDDLVERGVLVTINPDDPAMWPNGDMVHNLYLVGKLYGDEFVDRVIKNSIVTAWGLSQEEKAKWLDTI